MSLLLNNLTYKQWLFVKCIYMAKQILPNNLYILFSHYVIKLISYMSKSQIMKKIYNLCPPSNFPQVATICYKIKNSLTH